MYSETQQHLQSQWGTANSHPQLRCDLKRYKKICSVQSHHRLSSIIYQTHSGVVLGEEGRGRRTPLCKALKQRDEKSKCKVVAKGVCLEGDGVSRFDIAESLPEQPSASQLHSQVWKRLTTSCWVDGWNLFQTKGSE